MIQVKTNFDTLPFDTTALQKACEDNDIIYQQEVKSRRMVSYQKEQKNTNSATSGGRYTEKGVDHFFVRYATDATQIVTMLSQEFVIVLSSEIAQNIFLSVVGATVFEGIKHTVKSILKPFQASKQYNKSVGELEQIKIETPKGTLEIKLEKMPEELVDRAMNQFFQQLKKTEQEDTTRIAMTLTAKEIVQEETLQSGEQKQTNVERYIAPANRTMFALPKQTRFDKNMPKEIFYQKGDFSVSDRELFVSQIAKITWSHKIAPNTINIEASEDFTEIQVIHIALKSEEYQIKILSIIQKMIPYHIVFVLSHKGQARLAVYQTKWLEGEWQPIDDIEIPIKGLTLEKAWENIVVTVGEVKLEQGNTLDEQITLTEEKKKLLRKIEALEKKARAEKQPKKKFAMVQEIKRLKEKL